MYPEARQAVPEEEGVIVIRPEARGATVESVRVYGWEFPEDTGPLEANIRALSQ